MKKLIFLMSALLGLNSFAVYNKAMQKAYKTSEQMTDRDVQRYEEATGEKIDDEAFKRAQDARDNQRLGRYSQPKPAPRAGQPPAAPVVATPAVAPQAPAPAPVAVAPHPVPVVSSGLLLDEQTQKKVLQLKGGNPGLWMEFCRTHTELKDKSLAELKTPWMQFVVDKFDANKDSVLNDAELAAAAKYQVPAITATTVKASGSAGMMQSGSAQANGGNMSGMQGGMMKGGSMQGGGGMMMQGKKMQGH